MIKYTRRRAAGDLPKRSRHDNKTRGGKTLVIAGSEGMWGAAVLSATAAARAGSGYVYVLKTSKRFPIARNPDLLVLPKVSDLSRFQAVAIGPGLSGDRFIKQWLRRLRSREHVVVDASALDQIGKLKLPPTWILTPHEGELARLMGVTSAQIKAARMKHVLAAQKKFGCVVLLKGHRTLVADGTHVYEVQAGNAALGKAGTGDVLTGIIAAFLSQGVPPARAAALGAFVHGYMADRWIKSGNDVLSLIASDLLAMLPQALKQIRNQ
jgi:NAD(P)H-hydrate epimerase